MKVLIVSNYGYRTNYVGGFFLVPGDNFREIEDWSLVKKDDPRIFDQLTSGTIVYKGKFTTWLRGQIAKDPELTKVDLSGLSPQGASILARYYEDDPLMLERLLTKAERAGVKEAFRAQLNRRTT